MHRQTQRRRAVHVAPPAETVETIRIRPGVEQSLGWAEETLLSAVASDATDGQRCGAKHTKTAEAPNVTRGSQMVGSGGVFFPAAGSGIASLWRTETQLLGSRKSTDENTPNGVYIWGFAFLGSRAGTFAYIGMYNMI